MLIICYFIYFSYNSNILDLFYEVRQYLDRYNCPTLYKKHAPRYEKDELQEAVRQVISDSMSAREEAAENEICKSTLIDYVRAERLTKSMPLGTGRPAAMAPADEQYLVDGVIAAAQLWWPLHREQIKTVATNYCQRFKLKPFQGNSVPGRDWMTAFTQRYKDQFSLRQVENLTKVKAQGLKTKEVCDTFAQP